MPELPDVEIFRKYFDSTSLNKKINKIEVLNPEMLSGVKKNELINALSGQKFISSSRHGKYFFAEAQNKKVLVLHFGMTGFIKYFSDKKDSPKHVRLLLKMDKDTLAFDDRRKLGHISVAETASDFIESRNLGPDALNSKIKFKDFYELIKKRTAPVKSVLMNQEIIAGIGNLYADEILFQSDIDPHSITGAIPEAEMKIIFNNMKSILKTAIKNDADRSAFPDHYLIKYRKKGKKCPRCGSDISISQIGGRTTYYCKEHQNEYS